MAGRLPGLQPHLGHWLYAPLLPVLPDRVAGGGHVQLVAKIRGLDEAQLDLLWEQVREHQQISKW